MKQKKIAALIGLSSLLVLTSCDTSSISESISDTVSNALPNLWVTLAQLGAFLVMVFVFFKFAYQPIQKKLKARNEYVAKNIKDSEQSKTEAEKQNEIASQNVKNSRVQAQAILEDANKTAQLSADKILAQANSDADSIRVQAEKDAVEREKKVDRDAHDKIIKASIAASKEILGREINEEDNEKVVNDFLTKMDEEEKKE